jgi:hypothetical protein
MQNSKQGMSSPGNKALWLFLFYFYFFFFSQQEEDRASIKIKLFNILDPYPMESLHTPHHFSPLAI